MNYPDIELYIDGRWKRASGQPVINPADESVLGTVPTATTADLDDALAAAERGFALAHVLAGAAMNQRVEFFLQTTDRQTEHRHFCGGDLARCHIARAAYQQ